MKPSRLATSGGMRRHTGRGMRKISKAALVGGAAAAAIAATVGVAAPASAEVFDVCPSGVSGVATADTSCGFADNVRRAWYSQPGTIIAAYSPVTHQVYTMQCTPTSTTYWYEAKRCMGVNSYGVGLIVFVD